jgi:hypothetical protein
VTVIERLRHRLFCLTGGFPDNEAEGVQPSICNPSEQILRLDNLPRSYYVSCQSRSSTYRSRRHPLSTGGAVPFLIVFTVALSRTVR